MTDEQKDNLIAWLNDAHAMEQSLMRNLEQQAKAAVKEGRTDVEANIKKHIAETKEHAELVAARLEALGGKISIAKDALTIGTGLIQGAMKGLFKDSILKSAIENLAAENLEIGSYKSLMAASEMLDDNETAEVCRRIIKDEEKMANWLLEQIPKVTREYLRLQS